MNEATGSVGGDDSKIEAIFKDENDEPILSKHLPLTMTLGDVRKVNPFGPNDLWIDFLLSNASRLEWIELFSPTSDMGAELCYRMNIDEIIPLQSGNESLDVASTVEAVIWNWSERIKAILGSDSFAVNWGGPDAKYVRADGSILYYLDGEMAYLIFEREYKSWEDIDAVTLNELSMRASVLCDFLDKMSDEIRDCHPGIEFHERKRCE
ncbi:MAG: hypothetical protein WCB27_18355 [Thermoguttaceae bacterium]